jgi:transcriptional regulator with XRE-family HTH domain
MLGDFVTLADWLDWLVPTVFPSYAALARATEVPESYVSRWRSGMIPEAPNLIKLANATGTNVETLGRLVAARDRSG